MADITGIPWAAIGSSLLNVATTEIEVAGTGFLAAHPDVQSFLVDATERLAKAMFLHAFEKDQVKKADLEAQMGYLKDALKAEAESVIIDVEGLAKSTFTSVVNTILKVGTDVLPLLLKAI